MLTASDHTHRCRSARWPNVRAPLMHTGSTSLHIAGDVRAYDSKGSIFLVTTHGMIVLPRRKHRVCLWKFTRRRQSRRKTPRLKTTG
jgi:hypothetical protein